MQIFESTNVPADGDSGVLIKAATSPGFYSDVASLDFPLSSGSLVSCENFSNKSKVRQSKQGSIL